MGGGTGTGYSNSSLEKEIYKIKIKGTFKSDSRLQKILNYLINISEEVEVSEENNPLFKINSSEIEVDREENILYLKGKVKKEIKDRLYKIIS